MEWHRYGLPLGPTGLGPGSTGIETTGHVGTCMLRRMNIPPTSSTGSILPSYFVGWRLRACRKRRPHDGLQGRLPSHVTHCRVHTPFTRGFPSKHIREVALHKALRIHAGELLYAEATRFEVFVTTSRGLLRIHHASVRIVLN